MMHFQALLVVFCTFLLAVTSATNFYFASKELRFENPSSGTGIRYGWWDRRDFKCPSAWGTFSDPTDCSSYYVCSGNRSSHKRCRRNSLFDMYRKVCLPKFIAICDTGDQGKTTVKTTPSDRDKTTPNDDKFSCPDMFGTFPHPKICAKYYSCTIFLPTLKTCPVSQLFDAIKKQCQPEDTVHCGSRERPTTTSTMIPSTIKKEISTESTSTEKDSTPNPSTITSSRIPDLSTATEILTNDPDTSVTTETSTVTPAKPTGPPDHNCDEDDVDCIITETGDVSDWFTCPEDMGSHPHPSSDKLFIFCLNWKPSVKKCGQDLVFSKKLLTCVAA